MTLRNRDWSGKVFQNWVVLDMFLNERKGVGHFKKGFDSKCVVTSSLLDDPETHEEAGSASDVV